MAAAIVQVQLEVPHSDTRVAKAILVVEDEPFVSNVTCDILGQEGYSVLWARSATEARRIFYRHTGQIAAIFCDAVLPDGNGIAFVRTLRRESPKLKVIVASGYPPSFLADTFNDGPGARFLSKPYSSAALIRAVRSVIHEGSSSEKVV